MAPDHAATGGLALCVAGAVCSYVAWRAGREAAALLGARRPERFSDLAAAGTLPALVALRGVVGCAAPLTCTLPAEGGGDDDSGGGAAAVLKATRSVACVLHETVVRSVYMARSWLSSEEPWAERERVVSRTLREAPFFLRDGSGARVWVLGAAGADGGALALAHDAFVPAPPQSLLGALLALLRGYAPLGVRTQQRLLPVGTRLTAVGEALQLDGALRLRRPLTGGPFYLSAATLEELAAGLRSRQRSARAWALGLTALGGALLLLHARERARRGAVAAQAAREEAQRQARLEAADAADAAADGGEGDGQCVVCYDRPQSCVFPGCGHLACCAACAARLTACPVCRKPGTATRVYRC
jgi:hypothetical protein